MVNLGKPSEPKGDYNTCHHSIPRVAGRDSMYHCKLSTSVYLFRFSHHVTSTIQYFTNTFNNERTLTDTEGAISKRLHEHDQQ